MDENIKHNQHLPIYNIKAVSRLVGLLPVTLRAWERRYGMPSPNRGQQGYRLYSDYDIRTLRWLKTQIGSGLSIGRAVNYLSELRSNGFDPAAETAYQSRPTSATSSPSLIILANQLFGALINFDEPTALEIIRRAFGLYPVDEVLLQVIQPAMIEVGDAWHRGELAVAVEHYATQFCLQHLMSMLAAAAPPSHPGAIIAACAPGEMHQIGLLMLVIILRWRGWNVKYLGPDLPLTQLEEVLRPVKPQVLMFSANLVENAEHLTGLSEIMERFDPHPLVVVGGQAFQHMRLPESVPAVYLNVSAMEAVHRIEDFMVHSQADAVRKSSAVKG
jgi:MerR family transcriptional regulator, light-induced transcriptional regulator